MKYELDLYDKWREGRVEGIKEGIEIGAITALKQGIPAETVASFTGLSVLEVEALKNKV